MIQVVRSLIGGFFMGTADLVPGVSGGTIALVLGIYERLVASIREGSSALGSLLKLDIEGFKTHFARVEWGFLLPLLGGILLAVVSLASFLEHQIEENPTIVAGVFFGLVIASIFIAWRLLKEPHASYAWISAAVAVVLFVVLGLGESEGGGDPATLAFFGAGALAICAMILPGISGSLILLMLGMYTPVLGAVTDRDFASLLVFAAGAVIGLALFSQVLHWALRRYHDPVLAGLIGLMAGSLRILWPWPDGVESPDLAAPGDDMLIVLVAGVIGAAVVYLISRLAPEEESAEDQPATAPLA